MAGHNGAVATGSVGKSLHSARKGSIRMVAPVSTSYCLLDEVEIFMQRLKPSDERMYAILNARGTLAFDVIRGSDPATSSAVLRDACGSDVLVMRKEQSDARNTTWAAYRGGMDRHDGELLFTVQKIRKLSPFFEIELPSHMKEQDSRGPSFTARTKRLFQGELSVLRERNDTQIAKARKIFSPIQVEKSHYGVTIEPGVDSAFIAAICIILDLVYRNWSNHSTIPRTVTTRIQRTLSENADGWSSYQAQQHRSEPESTFYEESSVDIHAENHSSGNYRSALAITLTCTLSVGVFFKSYLTLAEVLISFYLAVL